MTPREILIQKQDWCRIEIQRLEFMIESHRQTINTLEITIDEIDMAEAEAFNKGN